MELDFESNWISNATIPSIPEWRDLKIKKIYLYQILLFIKQLFQILKYVKYKFIVGYANLTSA